jgi:hypothetical protein
MLQPKVVHSLIIVSFITVVTGAVFFLLNRQLTPLLDDIANDVVTAGSMRVNAAAVQPTPTLSEITLDLLLTVPPPPSQRRRPLPLPPRHRQQRPQYERAWSIAIWSTCAVIQV